MKTLLIMLVAILAAKPSLTEYRDHILCFLEQRLETTKYAISPIDVKFVESQLPDGSWADLDYHPEGTKNFTVHAKRFRSLVVAYYSTRDEKYLTAARKALKFWAQTNPVSPNWWHNEIAVPKIMGPAMILLQDKWTDEELGYCLSIMKKSSIKQKGQNFIWQTGNVLMTGILENDVDAVLHARDTMFSAVKYVKKGEGLKSDGSFHQHGIQNQLGNYGLSFARDMTCWINAFEGTGFDVPKEKADIVKKFIKESIYPLIWNGYFDMNALGRQVFKDVQTSKAKDVKKLMDDLHLESGSPVGAKYFTYSKFGVYRTKDWYASVKMQSKKVKGYEMTNKENMRGLFSADGAVLVRRDGDEYNNISAVWNWRHIPGVTCYDDGTELYGNNVKNPYNQSSRVFGKADEDILVACMEIDRNGLSARKSWVFFPDGIVCLGAGISRESRDPVITGVEQCLKKGTVTVNRKWIHHNGITYIPFGVRFSIDPEKHTGDWEAINPQYSNESETKDLVDIYINHGKAPVNCKYAYAVIPTGLSGADAFQKAKKEIKIISNMPDQQIVIVNGVTVTVNWNKSSAIISRQ